MDEIDWKSKAKEMSDTYKELYNIRVESVENDIEQLRQKIQEHDKIHRLAVEEMKLQNNQLRAKIEEAKRNKAQISQLESSIKEKKRLLSRKDPILAKVFQFPNLHLLSRSKDGTKYLIGHGDEYAYQFQIAKEDSNLTYQGIQVPQRISSTGDDFESWAYGKIMLATSDLSSLLRLCSAATY